MSTGARTAARILSTAKRLPRWSARWWKSGLDLLFPPRCVYCDADRIDLDEGPLLCGDCRDRLAPENWVYCRRCGAPVSTECSPPESCRMCRGTRLRFDAVVSLGAYRSELGRAVLRMKTRRGELLSAAMGRLYADRRGADVAALRPDVVVPIPMYWSRWLGRGTNSPNILAECLARRLRVPAAPGMLVRRRKTKPQATLRPRQRFKNVRGVFRLRGGYGLEGARVVLFDDILTTGATSSEAAGVLKQAGASMVAVAVLARGVGDGPR